MKFKKKTFIFLLMILFFQMNINCSNEPAETRMNRTEACILTGLDLAAFVTQFFSIYLSDSNNKKSVNAITKLRLICSALGSLEVGYLLYNFQCDKFLKGLLGLNIGINGWNIFRNARMLKNKTDNASNKLPKASDFKNKKKYQYAWLGLNWVVLYNIIPMILAKCDCPESQEKSVYYLACLSEILREQCMYKMLENRQKMMAA